MTVEQNNAQCFHIQVTRGANIQEPAAAPSEPPREQRVRRGLRVMERRAVGARGGEHRHNREPKDESRREGGDAGIDQRPGCGHRGP